MADYKLLPYLRMRDQFRRRDNFPLLPSLPWESAWALINMRNDYSRDLLVEFHRHLRHRRHPTFDLQPLQYYIDQLAPPAGLDGPAAATKEHLNIVLALSYAETPNQPGPMLAGGIIFEYFESVNCALITHAYVLPSKRNRKALLERLLAEVARTVDVIATGLGHLAGASAILMTVHPVSAQPAPNQLPAEAAASMDLAAHHATLCDLNLRLLDLDLLLPPMMSFAAPVRGGTRRLRTRPAHLVLIAAAPSNLVRSDVGSKRRPRSCRRRRRAAGCARSRCPASPAARPCPCCSPSW